MIDSTPAPVELSVPQKKNHGFFSRVKFFLGSSPKRTKFLGIIFLLAIIPLIVVSALTVQNLQQKASVSDVVNITDSSGTPIESTATPNVFINVNLSASAQWKLPAQPSANSSFVKKAYAAGQSCVNMGANNCRPTDEYCKYNSCDEEGNCTGVCVSSETQESAKPQDDYSQLPTSTPTPLPEQALPKTSTSSPTPSPILDACSKLNPTLYKCSSSCSSLGEGWKQQTSWADISCPNAQQQCCYYRPILILRTVSIRNIDSGTGGQVPANITVNNAADIVRIPWKLNDLLPGETEAQRTVLVNLISKSGQSVGFNATVNFINLNNKIPTVSPAISPTKPDSESNSSQNVDLKNFDLNNDSTVNCKDTQIAANQYRKQGINLSADFDNDGQVTEIDLNAILRNYTPGDSVKCE